MHIVKGLHFFPSMDGSPHQTNLGVGMATCYFK